MLSSSHTRPTVALTLRALAAMLMLVALLLPQGKAEASVAVSKTRALAGPATAEEGGSCGESEEHADGAQVWVDCGAQRRASIDEPILVSLMRQLGVEMERDTCEELLRDIYSELSCEGRGPDCGQLDAGTPPPPSPKLAAGSSSAQSRIFSLELGEDAGRDALAVVARPLSSRDLQPPVPPPR